MSGLRRSSEKPLSHRKPGVTCYPDPVPVALAICGDSVVDRALVLLGGPRYETRFLYSSSLSEPGSLEAYASCCLSPRGS